MWSLGSAPRRIKWPLWHAFERVWLCPRNGSRSRIVRIACAKHRPHLHINFLTPLVNSIPGLTARPHLPSFETMAIDHPTARNWESTTSCPPRPETSNKKLDRQGLYLPAPPLNSPPRASPKPSLSAFQAILPVSAKGLDILQQSLVIRNRIWEEYVLIYCGASHRCCPKFRAGLPYTIPSVLVYYVPS